MAAAGGCVREPGASQVGFLLARGAPRANVTVPWAPGEARFDLVLCRNVLIYFEPALARQVTELLSGSLRGNGSVMLGAADVL